MNTRVPRTAFRAGHRKCGGRVKGVPNKATVEVKEAARRLIEDRAYRAALARRLRSGRIAPAMETTLWHYAYGKPKEYVEHTSPEGEPFTLRIIDEYADDSHEETDLD